MRLLQLDARPAMTSSLIGLVTVACAAGTGPTPEADPPARKADTFVVLSPSVEELLTEDCHALTRPFAGCHWTIDARTYCGGPVPPKELTDTGCECRTCVEDAHCEDRSGGRCLVLFSNSRCNEPMSACVYPGDACFDPEHPACGDGHVCLADDGLGVCGLLVREPPPS